MADVLIIGELLAELMAEKVDQRFDATGTFLGPYPSGAPGIFIDQVAKMGVSCAIVSCVGNDGFGDQIVSRLKKDGVDVSLIKRSGSHPTGTAFVTYNKDGSREFIFNISNSASGLINESMITPEIFSGCKFFHIMGSFLGSEQARGAIFKGIEFAKNAGSKISFDPNIRTELFKLPDTKDAILKVLQECTLFLPSETDLELLFGVKDENLCIKELIKKYLVEMIVIKKAAKGATFYNKASTIQASAYKIVEVDPTGAGDVFGGALIGSLLKSRNISDALNIACAAGALAVSKRGPMEGTAALNEIERFMSGTKR